MDNNKYNIRKINEHLNYMFQRLKLFIPLIFVIFIRSFSSYLLYGSLLYGLHMPAASSHLTMLRSL